MANISMNEARFLNQYVQKWASGRELNADFLKAIEHMVVAATDALLNRRKYYLDKPREDQPLDSAEPQ